MARKPTPPRVIPNFAMDKPWTEPMRPEEEEGMASTALLSGASPSDRAVSALIQEFAGDSRGYAQALANS